MKFGETLWQRSVPQWRNFNIDYHTIKSYIKDATTPSRANKSDSDKGKEKATSIPIPGASASTQSPPSLEERLLSVLQKEHERVGLFVRSKCYEIESRLGSIERQLCQLQRRRSTANGSSRAVVRLRSRFSKIESDILSVGNEIQNLSRFVAINRLAILKLVKKHKKWTGSITLGSTVQEQLLGQSESFTQTDLDEPLAKYTSFLSAVREPFSDAPSRANGTGGLDGTSNGVPNKPSRVVMALFQKSDIDFDAGMARLTRSKSEEMAVYWVHHDNVVELRILLLQYMRYASFEDEPSGALASGESSAESVRPEGQDGKAIPAGAVVLGKSNTNPASEVRDTKASTHDGAPVVAAVARWTPTGDARVCLKPSETDTDSSGTKNIVKLEKDRVVALLPLDADIRRAKAPWLTEEEMYATSDDDRGTGNILRAYIRQNDQLEAVAKVIHKRSRFSGLENGSKCLWASLDETIQFSRMSGDEKKACDVYKIPENEGQKFPHAVLSVRAEGGKPSLIGVLDNSHLTERVDEFTMEAHALALCHETGSTNGPPWLPKLSTDIRHIPSLAPTPTSQTQTGTRRSSNLEQLTNPSSSKRTPNLTSRSGTSNSPGPVTPDAETFGPPSVRASIQISSKSSLSKDGGAQRSHRAGQKPGRPDVRVAEMQQQHYWNEYDNPDSEMGRDEAFFIYVDPDAPLFPGQTTLVQWGQKVKSLFSRAVIREKPERDLERQGPLDGSALVRRQTLQLLSDSGVTSSDDEDDDDADDELSRNLLMPSLPHRPSRSSLKSTAKAKKSAYGTFGRARHRAAQRNSTADDVQTQPSIWLRTSTLCFAAAILIEAAMSLLLSTSRRSLRGEVNVAVVLGVAAALSFAAIGAGACTKRSRRNRDALLGAADEQDTVANGAKATVKVACFVAVCVWAGILVALSVL